MRVLAYVRSLAARVLHPSHTEDEVEEELRSYILHRAHDVERSGPLRAGAERRPRIEFGRRGQSRKESRDKLGGSFIETLTQDLRFAIRMLRKSPGFAAVAVVTLALGIGANAVVFSAINAFLMHPLNLPQEESLYAVWRANQTASESYPDYLDLRDRNRTFEGLAAYNVIEGGLDTGQNPSNAWGNEVSGNYFAVLGIQPYLGRLIQPSDEHGPNSAPYIVVSYAHWHTHFQDDRGVVGRTVFVNKHPFTVIGVVPPEFHGAVVFFDPAFYVPMVNEEQVEGESTLNQRKNHWVFMVMGHLKPGVTHAQAIADLNSIGSYLEKT